jgi:hypothetical protein
LGLVGKGANRHSFFSPTHRQSAHRQRASKFGNVIGNPNAICWSSCFHSSEIPMITWRFVTVIRQMTGIALPEQRRRFASRRARRGNSVAAPPCAHLSGCSCRGRFWLVVPVITYCILRFFCRFRSPPTRTSPGDPAWPLQELLHHRVRC